MRFGLAVVVLLGAGGAMAQSGGHQSPAAIAAQPIGTLTREALIAEALSAAPPKIAKGAAVKNWDGTTLRQGNEEYTCFPTPTESRERGGREPICLDQVWLAWSKAWMNNEPFRAERVGIAYSLSAEAAAGSINPFAGRPVSGDDLFAVGPHILLLLPDLAQLNAFPSDARNGGPFVRWKDTPYAHLMVPAERQAVGP